MKVSCQSSAYVMAWSESTISASPYSEPFQGSDPLILQPPHSIINSSEGSHPGYNGDTRRTEREGTRKGWTCFIVCTKELTGDSKEIAQIQALFCNATY